MKHRTIKDVCRSTPGGIAEKAILAFLCLHANEENLAWPSHAELARLSGASIRTVERAVGKLLKSGRIAEAGVVGRIKRYRILPPWPGNVPGRKPDSPTGQTRQFDGSDPAICPPTPGNVTAPWEGEVKNHGSTNGKGKARPAAPAHGERGGGKLISPRRDPDTPPGALAPADWREACALAELIEGSAGPVEDSGGETRATALALFAEAWPKRPWCRDRQAPWADIRAALEWANRDDAGEEGAIVADLRKYPDGALPGDGAGRPSRLERLIRRHQQSAPPPDPIRRHAQRQPRGRGEATGREATGSGAGTFAPPRLPRALTLPPEAEANGSPKEAGAEARAPVNGAGEAPPAEPTAGQLAQTREEIRLAARNRKHPRQHRARQINAGLGSPDEEARAEAEKALTDWCGADIRYREGQKAVGIR